MHSKTVSLISVCHGRWAHLQRTWRTRVDQTYPSCEPVFVASGAEDGPLSLLDDPQFHGVLVHVPDAPFYRAAYHRNLGGLASSGEYLAFVDGDVFVNPSWVQRCVDLLQRGCGIVLHPKIRYGGQAYDLTGTFMIHRWLWEKIGGYNENLDTMWGQEDIDIFFRAQAAGGRAGAYPAELLRAIPHSGEERVQHKPNPLAVNDPELYRRQGAIMEADRRLHTWEANRVSRFIFPTDTVYVHHR